MIKSRKKAMIIILSPLLLIFLVGIAFDNLNEYKIKVGVYSQSYSELTTSFISRINTGQFTTIKAKTELECIDSVKIGLANTCVVFPSNLKLGSQNKDVLIFIDYSNLNLAWVVRDKLFSSVEEQSKEITKQLTDNILSKLLLTKNEIASDAKIHTVIINNEESIGNKTIEALAMIGNINATIDLNSSDIMALESKISSFKAAHDISFEESQRALDYSEYLVKLFNFSDTETEEHLANIKDERSKIINQQQYIESLFDPRYFGSINNTIEGIQAKVSRINSNANNTLFILLKGKENLYNSSQIINSNKRLMGKLSNSMEYVSKELETIEELKAEDIAAPVKVEIKPISSYSSHLNYIFPTLMALAIMFASLFLSTIVVVAELNNPAFFRNLISPTDNHIFFFTSYLTNISLVGLQIFVMILISMIFFFSQVIGNILATLVICLLIATLFIVLGMGLGYLFKAEQISILAATFCASVFLFLSNILIPIENMPGFFIKIVQFNPFIISISLLRKSILFGQSLIAVNEEILYIVASIIVLLTLYLLVYTLIRRRNLKTA